MGWLWTLPLFAQNNQIVLNAGHSDDVNTLDLSADGQWLVTASPDRTIRIWNYAQKKLYRTLHSFTTQKIYVVVISPNGKYVAVGTQDNYVRIWDRQTGVLKYKLAGHFGDVNTLAFSPDNKTLASGSTDDRVIVWDLAKGSPRLTLTDHRSDIHSVTYSKDGRWLLSADERGKVLIWHANQGKVIRSIQAYSQGGITSIVISNDGKKIVTLQNSRMQYQSIDIWDFNTGQKIKEITGVKSLTKALAINRAATKILSTTSKGELNVWDIATGKKIANFRLRYAAKALAYSSDERQIIVGLRWNLLKILNASNGQEIFSISNSNQRISQVATAGQEVLITKPRQSAILWNGTQFINMEKSNQSSLFFSQDKQQLIGSLYEQGYAIWNKKTGQIIKKYQGSFSSRSKDATVSPDGKLYAVSGRTRKTYIHKVGENTKEPYRTITTNRGGRNRTFSPDGSKLVLSDHSKKVEIWDIKNNQLLHTLKGHYWGSSVTAYSPDGTQLISGGNKGNLVAWNPQTGRLIKQMKGHKSRIEQLTFSKNGRYILSGSRGGSLRLWSSNDYKFLRKLIGHKTDIASATFTEDNKKIISASQDGEVIVWDVATGLRLLSLWTFNQGKDYVAYTPDGRFDGTNVGIQKIHIARNDSILAIAPTSNLRVKDLFNKILQSQGTGSISGNKGTKVKKDFNYYNIVLLNPGEPSGKIYRETYLKHDKENLVVKGKLQNIDVKQIIRVKVNGRRATFNRNNLTFSSRRISFIDAPTKEILIEVYTKDGNVTTRLLRISATLNNITQKPALVVTKGHKKQIISIDFHPKGKYFVTAGEDQSIKIWDRSLKQEFRTLNGHKQSIRKVVFSPNGKYIASVDRDETILWKHPGGQIIRRIKSHHGTLFFSADSKKLLLQGVTPASGFSGNLAVHETATGKYIKEFTTIDLSDVAALHPNDKWLFSKGQLYDLSTGENKGYLEDQGKKVYAWFKADVSVSHFAAYSPQTQQILVWNISDTKNAVLRIPYPITNLLQKIKFTHDGKHLIVGSKRYRLLLYRIPTGRLVREIKLKNGTIASLAAPKDSRKQTTRQRDAGILYDFAISPDNKLLAANAYLMTFGATSSGYHNMIGVRFMKIKDGTELNTFGGYDEGVKNFAVTANEKFMISSHYGRNYGVRLWNLRKGQIDGFIPMGFGQSHGNGKQVAVYIANEQAIKVFSVPDFKEVVKLKNVQVVEDVYISNSGNVLIYRNAEALGGNQFNFWLHIWDISSPSAPRLIRKIPSKKTLPDGSSYQVTQYQLSDDDQYLVTKLYTTTRQGSAFKLQSLEVASGKKALEYALENYQDQILDFVPDKKHILVSKIIPDNGSFKSRLIELNYTNGELIADVETDYEIIFDAHFSADGRYLVTGSGGYWIPQNIHFDVAIWDWTNKNLNCVLTGHAVNVRHVWFGQRGKKVYSSDDNSIIKVWNISKCKLAGSFLGLNDSDYIILNADNYYKTSKGSIDGIGFRYKGKLRSFGQFDLRFNRPDLVMRDLGASKIVQRIYYKAWQKRLRRAGMTEAMIAGEMHLPEIEIPGKFDLPPATSSPSLRLNIKAQDENVALKNIQVYVNDVPLYGKNGLSAKGKQVYEQAVKITLNQGENKVAVSAINENGLESAKESFNIEYNAPKRKPNLYVLAIGVSKYENTERNLKFAEKDANDLTELLKKAKNYGKITIKKVLNENATKENILKAGQIFRNTTVDDQVIIYVSCHGLLDEKMDYYLATTNVNFNNPAENGLPYEAIEQMLDKIPARKRLIMIDACHSGELDKSEVELAKTTEVAAKKDKRVTIAFKGGSKLLKPKAGLNNSFDYMKALFNDISNHSGATVISAAAGYEFALESKEWNNGVFTYAILNGIKSGEADINSDQRISVSELKEFVIGQVSELTNGKQVPTTRHENQSIEVVIYEK